MRRRDRSQKRIAELETKVKQLEDVVRLLQIQVLARQPAYAPAPLPDPPPLPTRLPVYVPSILPEPLLLWPPQVTYTTGGNSDDGQTYYTKQ